MTFTDLYGGDRGRAYGVPPGNQYGDEWFVDGESMYFDAANNNSKHAPDEVKLAKINAFRWSGGVEWRRLWEAVRPAMEASMSS
jgi:hypothetical protein